MRLRLLLMLMLMLLLLHLLLLLRTLFGDTSRRHLNLRALRPSPCTPREPASRCTGSGNTAADARPARQHREDKLRQARTVLPAPAPPHALRAARNGRALEQRLGGAEIAAEAREGPARDL